MSPFQPLVEELLCLDWTPVSDWSATTGPWVWLVDANKESIPNHLQPLCSMSGDEFMEIPLPIFKMRYGDFRNISGQLKDPFYILCICYFLGKKTSQFTGPSVASL